MKIQNIQNIYPAKYNNNLTNPFFKGAKPVETIKNYNIDMMADGIIGKVKVFKKNGQEAFLNVDKFSDLYGNETYMLKDKIGNIIGEMDICIKKQGKYNKIAGLLSDPSHVFVQYLHNYSKPNTGYYTDGLEEYTGIGIRLLQIAQRRSDEALCNGEIKLSSKVSALNFYKKLGFVCEMDSSGKETNRMYLPPHAKEPLSRLYGGL